MPCIDNLSFKSFMDEIHVNLLTDSWEGVIEQSVLNSTQGDKPFWNWIQSLQATAALIVGTFVLVAAPFRCSCNHLWSPSLFFFLSSSSLMCQCPPL
jgi:hypothetical protein